MRETQRSPFALRLIQARKHAGLTQTALAKAVGMSQSTYGEAETIAQGSAFTPQIAATCGVSAQWLATGEGEMIDIRAWPFTHITPEQIQKLSKIQLQNVENYTFGLLGLVPPTTLHVPQADTEPVNPRGLKTVTFTKAKENRRAKRDGVEEKNSKRRSG